MDTPRFSTYWTIDGQRYDDLSEVECLVEAGHVAAEVPANEQQAVYERQKLLDKWYRMAVERYEKIVAEQHHRNSPEGSQEAAVRHAQMNPGGIVTLTGGNSVFDELDQYGPDATDIFK